ncbi:hypothetical protein [Arthrobacter subterraneus]|uniref:hypothetical protein n=1 Tax=Arthrobacter subterraneus TaxID=335973 RepID=UPI00382EC807
MSRSVSGQAYRFPDDRKAAAATACREGMLEREFRFIIDEPPGHDKVLGYPECTALLEVADLGTCDLVQFAAGDILVDLR